jgi:hypothetical protein
MLKLFPATSQYFTPRWLKLQAPEAEVAALPDQHSLKPGAE